jgi:hypothetical protein
LAKEPPSTAVEKDFGPDAYYHGREACRKALKAPSTAKFSNPYSDEHTGWSRWGYNQWKVFGYVDAQNSFGAMLREDWLAVVKKGGEYFEIVFLRLGDTESGTMPGPAPAPPRPALPRPATPDEIAAAKAAAEAARIKAGEDRKARAVRTMEWYQELAAKGDLRGQYEMGRRYLHGDGVETNVNKAIGLLGKAAQQGSAEAKDELEKFAKPPPR